ncbi:LacI family DNA-binding transcriptional regulator [Bacillus sp. JJ1533]|uniref:LacI family DNA-binding transcriptional regulator n=1 Tax=Bacillus sp. JJ1533 TaxID=3122959 RepID=UPI002FFF983F
MNPTIHDVAKLANTSKSTVSRYLNGQKVKKETEEALKKAIKELNYHRNVNARRLVMNKTQTIGIVVDDISNFFYSPIFKGIEMIAREEGFHCIFYSSISHYDQEVSALPLLYEGQVDGLILVSFSNRSEKSLKEIAESRFPIVLVGTAGNQPDIDSVDIDNYSGISDIVSYLYRLGHRKIAFISGPEELAPNRDRLAGYEDTMNQLGLETLVTASDWTSQGGYQAMYRLLENKEAFTAVIASNDESAVGALKAGQELGYQVPVDFSITGFDDIAIASWMYPSLTTMKQPFVEMGEEAAQLLISKIHEEQHSFNRILLKPELVIRDSCRKI